jgi:toxoflavin biosynthesis protein ToxD
MEKYMKLEFNSDNKFSKINISSIRENMGIENIFKSVKLTNSYSNIEKLLTVDVKALLDICENKIFPLEDRLTAGHLLAFIGDPRINTFFPKMETIPTANVEIGLKYENLEIVYNQYKNIGVEREWIEKECPKYVTYIKNFKICKYPVTNKEYLEYLNENQNGEIPSSWSFGIFPVWLSNHPVYTLKYDSVLAYIEWLNKRSNRRFRLPNEFEWEYVASNGRGDEFPWGNKFDINLANTLESGYFSTTPVGIYVEGYSMFGITDLSGNVEEYVSDNYSPYPGGRIIMDDLYNVNHGEYRIARGGSFTRYSDLARSKRRHGFFPNGIYAIGFRLAENIGD